MCSPIWRSDPAVRPPAALRSVCEFFMHGKINPILRTRRACGTVPHPSLARAFDRLLHGGCSAAAFPDGFHCVETCTRHWRRRRDDRS